MELTILGRYGPYPRAGGACSGYLVRAGQTRLVLDLGNGTLSRLLGKTPLGGIEAILLSHLHSDHMGDMLVLRYALAQLAERELGPSLPLPLVMPLEPELEYRQLAGAGVFDITGARPGMRINLGKVTVTLRQMLHPVPSYAMDITDGSSRLFYTGDTSWFDGLVSLCRGADLLLADTGRLEGDRVSGVPAHMTAAEAGRLARDAGVAALVCTHISPLHREEDILAEAARYFKNAEVAQEGKAYRVGQSTGISK